MCGDHGGPHRLGPAGTDDGIPAARIFRPRARPEASAGRSPLTGPFGPRPTSRRAFLGEFGRGTLALAVLTPILAACGSAGQSAGNGDGPATTGGEAAAEGAGGTASAEGAADTASAEGAAESQLRWARAELGFVSAYVLARGNRAAIVDTGVAGSADAIGQSLASLGLNYDDVDHVILTHKHGDHAGSIAEVTARATGAKIYAGQADLDAIAVETDADAPGTDGIVALTGGEDVFGLEMLATPGHTAGHMSVIDHSAGLLVAGDAVWTQDGGVAEGPARFFEDIPRSRDTIRQLAELSFNTLLVGHGEPIEVGADTAVAALADSLR